MGDYFYGCSDCPWRTEDVKIDNKDEFHDLLPYCDLKMQFIRKNSRQLTHNETCQEAIETEDSPVIDKVVSKE